VEDQFGLGPLPAGEIDADPGEVLLSADLEEDRGEVERDLLPAFDGRFASASANPS